MHAEADKAEPEQDENKDEAAAGPSAGPSSAAGTRSDAATGDQGHVGDELADEEPGTRAMIEGEFDDDDDDDFDESAPLKPPLAA